MTTGLSLAELNFYEQNGYLHVKQLLTADEAATYREAAHQLAERTGHSDATWKSVRTLDPGGRLRLTHCHDVQFYSAAFSRLILDPRLTGIAQAIIGPNVQLHHTKMFIKPPEHGAPFPMHQDYHYFPHEKHSMIAVIIHFDDAPVEKGCLTVIPGTHKLGPLEAIGQDHHLPSELFPADRAIAIPARAGDAIFMSYLLVHGSGINHSKAPRTTLLVQMRDPTDPPVSGRHQSRGQGMMLAGIDPSHSSFEHVWHRKRQEQAAPVI